MHTTDTLSNMRSLLQCAARVHDGVYEHTPQKAAIVEQFVAEQKRKREMKKAESARVILLAERRAEAACEAANKAEAARQAKEKAETQRMIEMEYGNHRGWQ